MTFNLSELILLFTPAILASGKINSRWRAKYKVPGAALISHFGTSTITEAWYLASGNQRGACSTCNGPVSFSAKLNSYSRFCSVSCGQLNYEVKEKRKQTNLERHGVTNAGGFGTKIHLAAMSTRYGVDHPMRSKEIKEKHKATVLSKYGVINVFAAHSVKEKIKVTVQNRYGIRHVMQLDVVKQQFRNDAGKWIPAVTNTALRKANTLNTITAGVCKRLSANGFELTEAASGFSYSHIHKVKHNECGTEFETPLYSGGIPRCIKCEPYLAGTSLLQQKVENFLIEQNVEIVVKKRLLGRKEIDIFMPAFNVGIEVNGLYYHSELRGVSKTYHLEKTNEAIKKGIRLIHLFEDDIVQRWDIVKSMILALLGKTQRIAARKCIVEMLDKATAIDFCNHSHLKGSAKFNFAIGAYYNGELVAVATFAAPRYSSKYEYELIRFCTALNMTVVGGFSKIMRLFEKLKTPQSLLSYADRSYSNGGVYGKCGFTLVRTLPPNYWYFNKLNIRQHQTQLRKYKLKRLYDNIDHTKTEWEILKDRGWNRIWDCGQLEFVKTYIGKI